LAILILATKPTAQSTKALSIHILNFAINCKKPPIKLGKIWLEECQR
jgi:hypothetical protein